MKKVGCRVDLHDLFGKHVLANDFWYLALKMLNQVKYDFLWAFSSCALCLTRLHIQYGVEEFLALISEVGNVGVAVHAENLRFVLVWQLFIDVGSHLLYSLMLWHIVGATSAQLVVLSVDYVIVLEDLKDYK